MKHTHFESDGPIKRVLAKVAKVKRAGDGWCACCPAHEDRTPSLSISVSDDDRVLLCCHAGCTIEAICEAIGLSTRDLYPAARAGESAVSGFDTMTQAVAAMAARRGTPAAGVWRYADATGRIIGAAVRFDIREGGKVVLPVSLQSGRWEARAMRAPRPLYGLPTLSGAARIVVCEGEKAADAAVAMGCIATTSAGGSSAADKTDWSPLAGRDVVLVPDNDAPGRTYMERVKTLLAALTPAPTVRLVELPGLPKSGDTVEFIAAHGGDAEAAKKALDALLEGAAPMEAAATADLAGLALATPGDDTWPAPLPIPLPLPGVLSFDPGLLPEVYRPWITDIANRMQCPIDFPAVGAMIAAGGVIGRKIGIYPKKCDDWLVIPNLWGVLIGRPSMMKSPPLREVMGPVKALVDVADRIYDQEMRDHRAKMEELELRRDGLKSKVRKALKGTPDLAATDMETLRGVTSALGSAPPRRKRYVVNDATVQALAEVLAENPNGVILERDELPGFLKSLDMESQQAARAFFLEAWDGNGRFESDRIGRGNTRLAAVCVSIVGTCQPGPIGEYLAQAVRGGNGDDGFMQRFQLAVYPDDSGRWVNVDEFPDWEARTAVDAMFARLNTLDAAAAGAKRGLLDTVPALRFDEAAYDRFIEWMDERENRLRSGTEAPAMEAHLVKYRSLIPSIALLCHLVDGGTGPVPHAALERAIGWGAYLESHARRIYAQGTEPGISAARALAEKILERKLADGFTLRDVYRPCWARLANKGEALLAVKVLVELDWLRSMTAAAGGDTKTTYSLNPCVLEDGFAPFMRG